MVILVTGGAGFIGSHLVKYLLTSTKHKVINLDKLTYAGNLASLSEIESNPNYTFIRGDICDTGLVNKIFLDHKPDAIMHLAAESHVDRSITSSGDFIQTNIVGTYNLLEQARKYWNGLSADKQQSFRFQHISTDEVYGSLGETGLFHEDTPYDPNSPYSASKAGSDHLVRAWYSTYKLPILLTNCSNNYGSFQYPEKLIPKTILNALAGKPIPIYGNGKQVRDWLYVNDHVEALYAVLCNAAVGETYNVGGSCEKTNLEIVNHLCKRLDELAPEYLGNLTSYIQLIEHVTDRAGHDFRYGIDASKIKNDLGWIQKHDFDAGMENTINWYLNNLDWCKSVSAN